MRISIIVTTRFEGFHCWPAAPDEVAFLRNVRVLGGRLVEPIEREQGLDPDHPVVHVLQSLAAFPH